MWQLVWWHYVISKCTIISHFPLSALSIIVTCFDTKKIQKFYAAQVLIIDYSFNFIISYTTEKHMLVEIMQIATK